MPQPATWRCELFHGKVASLHTAATTARELNGSARRVSEWSLALRHTALTRAEVASTRPSTLTSMICAVPMEPQAVSPCQVQSDGRGVPRQGSATRPSPLAKVAHLLILVLCCPAYAAEARRPPNATYTRPLMNPSPRVPTSSPTMPFSIAWRTCNRPQRDRYTDDAIRRRLGDLRCHSLVLLLEPDS